MMNLQQAIQVIKDVQCREVDDVEDTLDKLITACGIVLGRNFVLEAFMDTCKELGGTNPELRSLIQFVESHKVSIEVNNGR